MITRPKSELYIPKANFKLLGLSLKSHRTGHGFFRTSFNVSSLNYELLDDKGKTNHNNVLD